MCVQHVICLSIKHYPYFMFSFKFSELCLCSTNMLLMFCLTCSQPLFNIASRFWFVQCLVSHFTFQISHFFCRTFVLILSNIHISLFFLLHLSVQDQLTWYLVDKTCTFLKQSAPLRDVADRWAAHGSLILTVPLHDGLILTVPLHDGLILTVPLHDGLILTVPLHSSLILTVPLYGSLILTVPLHCSLILTVPMTVRKKAYNLYVTSQLLTHWLIHWSTHSLTLNLLSLWLWRYGYDNRVTYLQGVWPWPCVGQWRIHPV